MISKEELEKWAFQLNMDGDCDATDKDIETLINQMLDTMEELETAKRCLPVDKEFEVKGSWIGSVQNYIVHLEESLRSATAYIEKLREWNVDLAQESFERQERIVELTAVSELVCSKPDIADAIYEAFMVVCECHPDGANILRNARKYTDKIRHEQPSSEPTTVPGKWIPVSERVPEEGGRYWCYIEEQNSLGKGHYQWNCSWNGDVWSDNALTGRVTHWMPLPAAPQGDK